MTEEGWVQSMENSDQGYAEFDVKEGDIFRITGEKGWNSICSSLFYYCRKEFIDTL